MYVRTIAAAGALLGISAILLHFIAVQRATREVNGAASYGPAKVLQLSQATLSQSKDGVIRTVVWADRVEYSEEEQESTLTNVRFAVYPGEMGPGRDEPVEGSADSAIVRGSSETIVLIGNAHIYQGSRLEVRGEALSYDYGSGRIQSDVPVWMRDGAMIAEGQSLLYRLVERWAVLDQPKMYQ